MIIIIYFLFKLTRNSTLCDLGIAGPNTHTHTHTHTHGGYDWSTAAKKNRLPVPGLAERVVVQPRALAERVVVQPRALAERAARWLSSRPVGVNWISS